MSVRKSTFLIPAFGTALLVAGGVAAYVYLKGGPKGDISDAITSAKVVPEKALMATYISTDPKVWAKLEQFGSSEAQKLVAKGLADFNQNALKDGNISYEQGLKPWVGGVMIAVLPPIPFQSTQFNINLGVPSKTSNQPFTRQMPKPNVLMVVGIKDKLSALNFANKLKQQKGSSSKEINYKDQTITEATSQGKPIYTSVLNDHVVVAPEPEAIKQAIDTFKGAPSFATKEGANTVLNQGVNVENTIAQVYIPDYAGTVQQLLAISPHSSQLPPSTLTQLQQVKSMVAGVGIDDAGVRMKTIAKLDPALVKFQYQNSPSKVVSQLPTQTIALINGQGISSWWTAVVEQSKDYPEFKQVLEQARFQLKLFNLDLDKDVFGWMDGEFGFATVPANKGLLAQFGFGGAFLFHTSDRQTATNTFTKLDNLVKTQRIQIAKKNLSGKDITEWQIPLQGTLLAHGWLDQDTLLVAVGDSIFDAIATPNNQSLENSDNFKAITGSLQKPNGGYFYLDMEKTVSLINNLAAQRQPLPPEANAILGSIRGVGITANSPDNSTAQMEMLLALKAKTK